MNLKVDLTDKNVLITGSTAGIGLAIARLFVENGANIIGNSPLIEEQEEFINHLTKIKLSDKQKIFFCKADLVEPSECKKLTDYAINKFNDIDILVNNAGIQYVSEIENYPDDMWLKVVALNLNAPFFITKAIVPHMKKNGYGRIINLGSAHALRASAFKSAYCATKHGIHAFTKVLALELATVGITANTICPGYSKTALVEKQVANQAKVHNMTKEEVLDKVMLITQPTKKLITPEEIANLALYLSSYPARNITGVALSIDGGWTAK